jgi:hypothetical protein
MTRPIRSSAEPGEDVSLDDGQGRPYETPVLTPIGCLHDLLAGGGTQPCDGGVFQGSTGGNAPANPSSPTLC